MTCDPSPSLSLSVTEGAVTCHTHIHIHIDTYIHTYIHTHKHISMVRLRK